MKLVIPAGELAVYTERRFRELLRELDLDEIVPEVSERPAV